MPETPETNPARIVADADVLVADLLGGSNVDNPAREAMDEIRSHSWVELVASDHLLDDAEALIRELADEDLAAAWRERIEDLYVEVEHPEGDHPALASAYQGEAAHILSGDENLRSAEASATFGSRLNVSVKTPAGFASLFDAESLYESVEVGEYPGPDRDPRE
jgi:predicted nucleic acid-binding protein